MCVIFHSEKQEDTVGRYSGTIGVPSSSLAIFKLAYQEIDPVYIENLVGNGVPDKLIKKLCNSHRQARLSLARAELKILYSFIPLFETWLKKTKGKALYEINGEFSQWHAFIRRVNALEELLMKKRGYGEDLRRQLNNWKNVK